MRGSCPPGLPLRGSGAPWKLLCQMEKEGMAERLSSRLRCWVCSRSGLQSLLPEVLGVPGEVPAGQSAHFTQSRFTEPAPLELCAHPSGLQRGEMHSKPLSSVCPQFDAPQELCRQT